MAITGYLDFANANGVKGWAYDPEDPQRKIEIEILVDGNVVDETTCNHYRPDLEQNGIGDGHHAYFHYFNKGPLFGNGKAKIEARAKGTEIYLNGGPKEIERAFYNYIAMDLVDNCNLRCPFCLYDYANTKKTHYMSEENFEKILQLLPYVPDSGFWMSCLHEPSLHPDFVKFINKVPEEFRSKVFFTSNFARKSKGEYLEALADTNIHHINISVDSLSEELYPILRKGSRLPTFLENLDKLTEVFSKNSRAPRIRFITMVFKSNFDELENIIETCATRFNAYEHELRYPYKLPHITDAFKENHFLEHERWNAVEQLAKSSKYNVFFDPPKSDYKERVYSPIEYYLGSNPYEPVLPPKQLKQPFGIRFSCNGDVRIEDMEEHFHLNASLVKELHPVFKAL